MALPKAVEWRAGELYLLDQTRLPHEEILIHCKDVECVFEAICALRVRGAPAIGIAAAYGMLIGLSGKVSLQTLEERHARLISARPTAVNLAWALNRLLAKAKALVKADNLVPLAPLQEEAMAIHEEDRQSCRAIGDHGLKLLSGVSCVLTHCNAGSLAVSEYGTALAPIYRAHETGQQLHVFVDETRPLLQGARLTSYELHRHGVPHTLITDSMSAHVMSRGQVEAVIVGADRVTANGDVANKIGTLALAIQCQYYGIPFYVACPVSTIDLHTGSGKDIVIEERPPEEVRQFMGSAACLSDINVFNPAFDVTPARLVTALITERGVLSQPDEASLQQFLAH